MRASASAVSERHELEPAAAETADHLRKRSPGSSSVWKCPQRSCRLTTAHSCARRTTWRAIRAGGDAVSQPPPGLTIGSGLTELRRVRVCLPAERAPRGRDYRGNAPIVSAIACAPRSTSPAEGPRDQRWRFPNVWFPTSRSIRRRLRERAISRHLALDHEEHRGHTQAVEHLDNAQRMLRIEAVVERQRRRRPARPAPDDPNTQPTRGRLRAERVLR